MCVRGRASPRPGSFPAPRHRLKVRSATADRSESSWSFEVIPSERGNDQYIGFPHLEDVAALQRDDGPGIGKARPRDFDLFHDFSRLGDLVHHTTRGLLPPDARRSAGGRTGSSCFDFDGGWPVAFRESIDRARLGVFGRIQRPDRDWDGRDRGSLARMNAPSHGLGGFARRSLGTPRRVCRSDPKSRRFRIQQSGTRAPPRSRPGKRQVLPMTDPPRRKLARIPISREIRPHPC